MKKFNEIMNKKDKNGLKQGYWEEEVYCLVYKGYYIDDLRHGKWSCYDVDSGNEVLTCIESYEKGYAHGIHTYFNEDGTIDSIDRYKNGCLHGVSLTFYDDGGGIYAQHNYENDELVGLEIYYKIDGSHEYIHFYL